MTIKVTYNVTDIYVSESVSATYINVSYEAPSGGGGAVWGDIIGTLSDQADLQAALDAKVPYTGATANVDLGEFELKAGQLELDQTPTGTAGVAVTRWNNSVGTLETTLKGGSVVLKHGRDMFERVVNKTGIQLTRAAYQAVRVSDAQGQRLAVQLAQANNDNNSADTIGLVVETIDNNQEGFIYTVGEIDNINTTGSLQGETWVDGDVLYLSPTIAGRITNIKPVAPQHLVIIGYVVYAHANNGKIYVKVMNGWELGELHDVNTTGATNGQVLKYNGTIWVPSSDTGITTLNTLTALSQTFATGTSGTDFNISSATSTHTFNLPSASATNRGLITSGDWTTFNNKQAALNGTGFVKISGTTISYDNSTYYLASNPSAYISLSGLSASAPLSYNNLTGAFSISQASGSTNGFLSSTDWTTFNNKQNALTNPVTGTGASGQVAYWSGTNTQTGSNNLFWDNANARLGIGTNAPAQALQVSGSARILTTGTGGLFLEATSGTETPNLIFLSTTNRYNLDNSSGTLRFFRENTDGTSGAVRMSLTDGGNLLLGSSTDNTRRLQVAGDGYFSGNVILEPTTGTDTPNLTFLSTINRYNIDALNGTLRFFRENSDGTSGAVRMNLTDGGNLLLGSSTDSGQRLQVIGDTLVSGDVIATGSYRINTFDYATTLTQSKFEILSSGNNATDRVFDFGEAVRGWTITGLQGGGGNTRLSLNARSNNVLTEAVRFELSANSVGGLAIMSIPFSGVSFAPTSGTSTFTAIQSLPTINQTGGANGITRGLYVNPTLTAAADWRSIEWSNNTGWGLYGIGSAPNYLAGTLTIGGTYGVDRTLFIGRNMTGSTTFNGILNEGIIQADVTTSAIYYRSQARGANALTLTNIVHYYAQQASLGTGSTVTNQFGYHAESNLIGATNNFGFYGNIPSGTGRWNFYANGTALNYMNGALLLGSTTSTGEQLQVTGTMRVTGASTFGGNMALNNNTTNAQFSITNNTNTTSTESSILLQAGSSTGAFGIYGQSKTAYKIISSNDLSIYKSPFNGDIAILNDNSGGSIKMAAGGSSTAHFTIASTGAATFSSSVTGASFIPTSSTIPTNGMYLSAANTLGFATASTLDMVIDSVGSVGIGTSSVNASAILQTDSTTKGFLPPRMTTTQRNAITTPAAGLIVYDTTDNKHYGYNGTTWNAFY